MPQPNATINTNVEVSLLVWSDIGCTPWRQPKPSSYMANLRQEQKDYCKYYGTDADGSQVWKKNGELHLKDEKRTIPMTLTVTVMKRNTQVSGDLDYLTGKQWNPGPNALKSRSYHIRGTLGINSKQNSQITIVQNSLAGCCTDKTFCTSTTWFWSWTSVQAVN